MGNNISNQKTIKPNECLICWENIDTQHLCKCVKCNILLHDLCEELYRGNKKYCECPHCRRVGTIGSFIISV
jgi:hypothetical protein